MTVAELIAELNRYPGDAEVLLFGDHKGRHVRIDPFNRAGTDGEPMTRDEASEMALHNNEPVVFIDAEPIDTSPSEEEIIEAGGLPVDFVLKDKLGHLIDEAVVFTTNELMKDWPVRDAIRVMMSDRYWGRLTDEWYESPAISDALRGITDAEDIWNEFVNIVFERAGTAVRAAQATAFQEYCRATPTKTQS